MIVDSFFRISELTQIISNHAIERPQAFPHILLSIVNSISESGLLDKYVFTHKRNLVPAIRHKIITLYIQFTDNAIQENEIKRLNIQSMKQVSTLQYTTYSTRCTE